MDKVFMLIVLFIVGFWGYLKYSDDTGNWVATSSSCVIGEYGSYDECVDGAKSQIDITVESYSCSRN